MKKILKLSLVYPAVFVLLLTLPFKNLQAQGGPGASISYQTFYDDLSPYGTWIDYPAYGQVWHPNVNGGFRPYLTNGYWDYSNDGWMWMSNYDWGWAPFHYGRWVYDDMYGWLWIPGYEWSPAWVTWGMFGNNYAWAPLMPGINVGISFGFYRPPSFYWNAVGREHIYDRDIYNRSIPRKQIINNVSNITVINNFGNTRNHNQYYSRGPKINEVEKYTKRTITPAKIGERNFAGPAKRQGDQLQVYRPAITTPMPKQFRQMDKDHVQPLIENGDQAKKARNEEPVRNNVAPVTGNENSMNRNVEPAKESITPATRNENPIKGNELPVNRQNNSSAQGRSFERNNASQPRPVYHNESELRNNEMEQRQNVERLPVVRAPQSVFGHKGGENRRR